MIVVTHKHEPFYMRLLSDMPSQCLVVQPNNKGTTLAILYSLLRLASLDSRAIVAFFPSDHYFSDETRFMAHIKTAFETALLRPEQVILLGIKPESPET